MKFTLTRLGNLSLIQRFSNSLLLTVSKVGITGSFPLELKKITYKETILSYYKFMSHMRCCDL